MATGKRIRLKHGSVTLDPMKHNNLAGLVLHQGEDRMRVVLAPGDAESLANAIDDWLDSREENG